MARVMEFYALFCNATMSERSSHYRSHLVQTQQEILFPLLPVKIAHTEDNSLVLCVWDILRQVKSDKHALSLWPLLISHCLTAVVTSSSMDTVYSCSMHAKATDEGYSKRQELSLYFHYRHCIMLFCKQGMLPPHALILFPINPDVSKQNYIWH